MQIDWSAIGAFLRMVLSWLGGAAVAGGFIYFVLTSSGFTWWQQLVGAALALLFGFAAVAMSRYALGSTISSDAQVATPPPDPNAPIRSRIAPLIIGIGTAGILALSVALVIAFSMDDALANRDTLLMGIFTAVLPVFSTWVGTVLAFYFTNESFRQASEVARGGMLVVPTESEPITAGNRMIPYDKITKYEVPSGTSPETVSMAQVRPLFTKTATRVILFQDKRPSFIVRSKFDFPQSDQTAAQTVNDYLNRGQNKADATNYSYLPLTATVLNARTFQELYKVTDLFVNDSGTAREPIKGWVPDDNLKS